MKTKEPKMPKKVRSRKVKFEGRQIPFSRLPNGSLFIEGMWYSSACKLPLELRRKYKHLFRKKKGRNGSTHANKSRNSKGKHVPTINASDIGSLLFELKRVENLERQFRGFSKYYWDHIDEHDLDDANNAQLYFQKCAKLFELPCSSYPQFLESRQTLEEYKANLGVALMKMTYSVEEKGGGDDHRIVLYLQPKPMSLPREGIDGRWVSQNRYIQLCMEKGEPMSIEKLRRSREENKGNMEWAEDLSKDKRRWGTDNEGRFLKRVGSNLPPLYFAYFSQFPNARTIDEHVDVSNSIREW